MIRSLNEDETSPLTGDIKMLGTGRGRVSQAPLAEEIVDFLDAVEKIGGGARMNEVRQHAKRFFLNYMKAVAGVFPTAWAGRKYSIKTGAALRAFIRVAPDVMARARELARDAFDFHAIREAVKPWGDRLKDRRFETEGEWKNKLAGRDAGDGRGADAGAAGGAARLVRSCPRGCQPFRRWRNAGASSYRKLPYLNAGARNGPRTPVGEQPFTAAAPA